MEVSKAVLRKNIADQKELKKVMDRRMTKVISAMVVKVEKRLAEYSEATDAKLEGAEDEFLCGAVQSYLRSTTSSLQQTKLLKAVRRLNDDDIKNLVQSELYRDLLAYMHKFLDNRSVGALKKHTDALKKEANDIHAENAKLDQFSKTLEDRLASTGDQTNLTKIIEARKEKTLLLTLSQEKTVTKRQRLQSLTVQKEQLLLNLQKQDQKVKDFRVLELLEEGEMTPVAQEFSDKEKSRGK